MRLWHPTLSKTDFRSGVRDSDEASTGKWIVTIKLPDIGKVWEEIEDAAVEGRLAAVKKSTLLMRQKIGHDLVCIYCARSDQETVADCLAVLRDLGVEGDLFYKSDRATDENRDDHLYRSSDFEVVMKLGC
ncbi:putative phosphothreonine lyase domain-containg protein [Agrobacterium tumefaciens]|uniref:DUF1917 domain-containing protein n=1 Tax=Agrobacterium tumefaciens TaxID=358 RepID=A0A176XC80_AGRTU|nr:putative phosphothreonine lyase domain-containg protein [Agrobacterium tumefaciens]OAE45434.1 hypothetical protein A7J57_00115 [Agrobacterium tumefaciens]